MHCIETGEQATDQPKRQPRRLPACERALEFADCRGCRVKSIKDILQWRNARHMRPEAAPAGRINFISPGSQMRILLL
jgi:hypothetical protein